MKGWWWILSRPRFRFRAWNRSSAGPWGERLAARYLQGRGLKIISRNFRANSGEIDLVTLDNQMLVFVEVKTCAESTRVQGLFRIDRAKQRRLRRVIGAYIRRYHPELEAWRVDAVAIEYRRGPWWRRRRVISIEWYPAFVSFD